MLEKCSLNKAPCIRAGWGGDKEERNLAVKFREGSWRDKFGGTICTSTTFKLKNCPSPEYSGGFIWTQRVNKNTKKSLTRVAIYWWQNNNRRSRLRTLTCWKNEQRRTAPSPAAQWKSKKQKNGRENNCNFVMLNVFANSTISAAAAASYFFIRVGVRWTTAAYKTQQKTFGTRS